MFSLSIWKPWLPFWPAFCLNCIQWNNSLGHKLALSCAEKSGQPVFGIRGARYTLSHWARSVTPFLCGTNRNYPRYFPSVSSLAPVYFTISNLHKWEAGGRGAGKMSETWGQSLGKATERSRGQRLKMKHELRGSSRSAREKEGFIV